MPSSFPKLPLVRLVLLVGLLATFGGLAVFTTATPAPSAPDPAGSEEMPVSDATWTEIERLMDEQKFREALDRSRELVESTRAAGDAKGWTRAVILSSQLQGALGELETAVEDLLALTDDASDLAGPTAQNARTILDLYTAQALTTYLNRFGWQIRQRERTVEADGVPDRGDLGRWTFEQIVSAAEDRFHRAWSRRDAWGDDSLGDLSPYFDEGNYPPRIRGTLRDTISYLYVDFLRDSSVWPVRFGDATGRLDLSDLLESGRVGRGSVDDSDTHPLVKIATILGDLEAWHDEAGRSEASFEAYRVRIEALGSHRTSDADRDTLRAALVDRLEELPRELPWWSMGRATVAQMVRQGSAPARLIEAREIALDAARAHPDSVGARKARAIVGQIEAPSFQLESMVSDGLGERSILVRHKNFDRLYFRAYAVDLGNQARSSRDFWLLPRHQDVQKIVRGTPTRSWTVDLPATADYLQHQTFVTPPLEATGLYVVVASAREDFRESSNQLQAVHIVLGDLLLFAETVGQALEITARSGKSGEPVAGAELEIYRFDWRKDHQRLAVATTGADGRATVEMPERSMPFFVVARHGDDEAFIRSHHATHSSLETTESALLSTDRPVYRPEQRVQWKVVAYRGEDLDEVPRYATLADRSITVSLYDANGEEVDEVEVTTNEFGSASGSMTIPAGRLLGSWRLGTSMGGGAQVLVEEYKRPTFEVNLLEPDEALKLDRRATVHGEARYYFGLPVSDGDVDWRVVREPVYPLWWGWWWRGGPSTESRTIASGTSDLDADGRFELTFLPEAPATGGEQSPHVTYRFRVEADVVEAGGETRSDSRAFRLGRVAVDARVDLEQEFVTVGEVPAVTVTRRDLDGTPRPGVGRWKLLRIDQPAETPLPSELPPRLLPADVDADDEAGDEAFATPGDALRPRWATEIDTDALLRSWPDGDEIASGRLEHGDDGAASIEMPARRLAPGAYRLRYTTDDAFGETFTIDTPFLVVGDDDFGSSLPLVVDAAETTVEVGGTARVLAASGFEGQPVTIELYRHGRRVERWTETAGPVLEIPVDEALRGGFTVAATTLRDFQQLRRTVDVFVPWTDRTLDVSFSTFRDRLRPGDTERWTVTVRDPEGEPLGARAAEVLALMYDRSLDVFATYQPPDPLTLLPRFTGAPNPTVSLGHTGAVWHAGRGWASVPRAPSLVGTRLDVLSGLGIGGLGRMFAPPVPMRSMRARGDAPAIEERLEVQADDLAAMPAASPVLTDEVQNALVVAEADGDAKLTEGGDEVQDEPPLRTDFSETAFFEPHLATGDDGSVSFSFTVPDSVTDWNVWAHAITRDLHGGSAQQTTRSVKDLLVRPALPRFLRAGDRGELRVNVDNAGEAPFDGTLRFSIEDPETGADRSADFGLDGAATRSFSVDAGRGTVLVVPVVAPREAGTVAIRVAASAETRSDDGASQTLADGELRPLPILPSRLHLAQSRFAALSERDTRVLELEDLLATDDPDFDPSLRTEQLVVTIDAQLFYQVLEALPYLVEYPYECTEQTLNRFVSTSIVTNVFDQYPAVAAMAEQLAARETRTPAWSADDPNRRMLLVESPWLRQSRGHAGGDGTEDLLPILDPSIASAQRARSIAQLEQSQTSLGAFPWFPGGPPSPYMTLYILHGLSKVLEQGGEVPRPMVQRAWSYLHRHYVDELARDAVERNCCWWTVTFLNYVLSAYPEDSDQSWTGGVFSADDRRAMLDLSFRHWREHSPLLKAQLALTLHRAGRTDDAMLVFDSLLDSARTDEDLGTYWAPEERAWLWYNDTIEGHAFALRALMELRPDDPRRHGLVQWLFLEKQLGHWKSTRATAEVIWALVHYLEAEGQLGATERVQVVLGPQSTDPRTERFVFEPDEFTGKENQIVVPGDEVTPAMGRIEVSKESAPTVFASATWHFSTERLPDAAEGDLFRVTRRFFRRVLDGEEWTLRPLEDGERLEPGDQVEVQLTVSARHAAEYVHLRDPRPAGTEPDRLTSGYRWDQGLGFYEEIRDSGTNFFFDWLPAGEYILRHRLRASVPGTFRTGPATLQSLYAPEFTAYSTGTMLEVAASERTADDP